MLLSNIANCKVRSSYASAVQLGLKLFLIHRNSGIHVIVLALGRQVLVLVLEKSVLDKNTGSTCYDINQVYVKQLSGVG